MARTLQDHPEYGLTPVGFLDNFDDTGLPIPVLGTVRSLDLVLREYEIRRVIIAFGSIREPDMVPVVRACDRASVDIHVLPRFFELGATAEGREVDDIWGMPVVRLPRPTLQPMAWRVKRAFDVLVASVFLVVTAPVFALLALLVRMSSPGPVLFRQKRVGQHGRVVDVLKFRSMRENLDCDTQWSVRDDERTTRIGRFMRRTSLDELPQFINVLKGEMSLVGPRPERPFFVNQFQSEVPRYGDRHRVPVGMTGWAQVHGLRGDTSIEQRARFDNQYIENWSVWRDLVILSRTARAIVKEAFDSRATER
jgi:exopolysaccharide biosynthesis polyprenyl glycosylphosphotransferase